jgi:hypothetical protein
MPVFTETSSASRDLRILPSFALPLPRLSPAIPEHVVAGEERYEVVAIGVSSDLVFNQRFQVLMVRCYDRLDLQDYSLPSYSLGTACPIAP